MPDFHAGTVAEGRLKFRNLRRAGKGAFGQVYRATATGSFPSDFALKRQILKVESTDVAGYLREQDRQLGSLRREARIYFSSTLNRGHNRHLALVSDVAFVTHANDDGSTTKEPVLAMPWANAQPHNTLRNWMKANTEVSEHGVQERLSLAIQMFSGLVEMHCGGHSPSDTTEGSVPLFVHQDLKPDNMLLFGDDSAGQGPMRLALTDFGLSVCYNGAAMEAACGGGTFFFNAPEQLLRVRARRPDRDIWAAAIVLAMLFASEHTLSALQDYRRFSGELKRRDVVLDDARQLCTLAEKIARAVEEDGVKAPGTRLSRTQQALAPLLSKCFLEGCELRGLNFPGYVRPTSSECVTALRKIWSELGFQPWDRYVETLPQPQPTALQKHYTAHGLANFYLEHMEAGMLKLMTSQCSRLLGKVEPCDESIVRLHMDRLQKQLESEISERAKFHRREADKEKFGATSQCQVSSAMRLVHQ